ncbi:hypothetical protein PO878_02015 [Iamia majanohamensis]|uniref:DUF6777 domain-containing protein n=1 Tax=Iamia majanohamensis TaxID=467976 RepID=A0AAF0BWI8_9ACTN|nr:DUF6777 domain-containing protein [Iamia majanohamensis]WCO67494.1 hypothetical protein PO878_02015 [Iamia majanohamensis]
MAAVLLCAAVVGALVLVAGDDSDGVVEVELEAAGAETEDPFTPSVVEAGVSVADLLASPGVADQAQASAGPGTGDVAVAEVRGNAPRLYASRSQGPVCDAAALTARITESPERAAAWAGAAGVEVDGIEAFVSSLTPLVLTRDTAVTNHRYGEDGAQAYQAVLQAGTPVLVDDRGTPRVRCTCGNPLLEPRVAGEEVDLAGERWEGFDPARLSGIRPSAEPVATIETVDVATGEPVTTALGGTVSLDGLLVSDATGVHVDSEAGERRATVLDRPAERAFDDGAGGLIFNEARPFDPRTAGPPELRAPDTASAAAIWHLPAGAQEPVELFSSDDPATRWFVAEGTGTLGGARVLVYAEVTVDPEAPELEQLTGRLMLTDLDSGDKQVLEEVGYANEVVASSITVGGDRVAYETGFGEASWTVRDAALEEVETACAGGDGSGSGCVGVGALSDATTLVGIRTDEVDRVVGIQVDDLDSGEARPVETAAALDAEGWVGDRAVDARDGEALVSSRPEDGSAALPTVLVDVAAGTGAEIPVPGIARFLDAPLVRPAGSSAPASEVPTTTTAPPTTTTAPPTTAPPTTTTAPPTTTTAPPPEQVAGACGTVTASNGEAVAVFVESGSVACAGAVTLADTYYNDPSVVREGSGGFATIGDWSCSSTSAAVFESTGEAGSCEGPAGRIVMRRP